MPFSRWCGALAILSAATFATEVSAECWDELNALPSNTTATVKVNKVLECAVEQGVELNRLRSAIDSAEAASDTALQARDAAIEAVADIASTANKLEQATLLLEQLHNPWVEETRTFKNILLVVEQERQNGLALTEREIGRFEFAIFRNGGFRELTFSEWNGGIRVMTDEYIRGDQPSFSAGGQYFALGGSFWVLGTDDKEDVCPDEKVRHYYYQYQQTGVHIRNSNGCSMERGPIFKRKRVYE